MRNPWQRKMEQFTTFSDADKRTLDAIVGANTRHYDAGEDIIREGEHSPDAHLVISGMAIRYKVLEDGTRQIMAFLVPGDLCDAEIFILEEMDHSIATLAPSLVTSIAGPKMLDLLVNRPGISLALWWATLQDEAVLRERIVDIGRRDAYTRIAFLIYEMFLRLRNVGLVDGQDFEFPITQADLADATGLTPVYVNRTLQRLRDEGLISVDGKRWSVLDDAGLRAAGNFNPNYLHYERSRKLLDTMAGASRD
jgi:CRP-like cAMP-binding protein